MDLDGFTKKSLSILRDASPMLRILVEDLENVNRRIDEVDIHIAEKWETNQYARIIETIPGNREVRFPGYRFGNRRC
jgi:hypothetical protein